ncbi:pPIWI_RE module domain-containing protein [Streptomyces sp. NPDC018057]|uniref:pPIWI_RE module domain-containing protein n=1 Tax=unclassified Streptomyces TaxID=2593676 RepID=UPI00379FB233
MPSYPTIRLAAFERVRGHEFVRRPHGLAFPAAWRKEVLDFYRIGRREPQKINQVPIRRLNEVIRTVAPELLCVASKATLHDDAPWLYAYSPLPVPVMRQLIHSWIRDLHTPRARAEHPEITERAVELGAALDVAGLSWQPQEVDLFSGGTTPGGTFEPDALVHQLLPDALAQDITRLDPYRFEGVEMEFRIAATTRGAELVSWPPRDHQDEDGTWWKFSFVIALTVQTVPFSDFRLHVATGVRRWRTGGPVPLPFRRSVSAYLLAREPWLAQTPGTGRMAVGRLITDRRTASAEWARGGPEGMLGRLRFSHRLPDAATVQEDPDVWMSGKDGVQIGVVHATSMGGHGVGAGLMPRDRSPLTDWAAEAFSPHLARLTDFTRSRHAVLPRNLPKAPTGKTKEERALSKKELEGSRSHARRAALGRTLDGAPLVVEARWQNPRTRDALVEQLADLLGLDGAGGTGAVRSWSTPQLEVRLYLEDASFVAARLDFPDGRPRRKHLASAIGTRRREIAELCARDGRPDVQAVVIEIGHPSSFRPDMVDPKFAARLGYADAGRLTKFITVPSSKRGTATKKNIAHRAHQTWSHVFRQLGSCTVPEHSVDEVPDDLDHVALWMVKRRADGPTYTRRTVPVAVRVSAADGSVTGWDPESGDWIPYRELLLSLARDAEVPGTYERFADVDDTDGTDSTDDEASDADEAAAENEDTAAPAAEATSGDQRGGTAWVPDLEEQRAQTAQFVRSMLYSLRGRDVLLLSHAQNARRHWPWLTNGRLIPDALQFGANPAQHISLYGERLCHVRVRDDMSGETPQWFAPDDESGEHGFASGLWHRPDATGGHRVHLSTGEKPHTAKHAVKTASKIATRIPGRRQGGDGDEEGKEGKGDKEDKEPQPVIDTGTNAWNPAALEIAVLAVPEEGTAEAGAWAAVTHQLRRAPDYDVTLKLPLPLHLARKTAQYVLPHEDDTEGAAPEEEAGQ